MFSGQRMMTSYIRIGGLALEPPRGWQQARRQVHRRDFPAKIDEYENLLTSNPDLDCAAPRASGYFRSKTCSIWASPGPCSAPPACRWDIRKDEPYSSYEKFDFKVPDAHGKRRVRPVPGARGRDARERARSSQQALEGMPDGPLEGRRAAGGPARPRKDEDADGGAHLPLQDRHRGLPRAGRRGLPGRRIAARRNGLLRGERRHAEAATACTCARPASAICRRSRR